MDQNSFNPQEYKDWLIKSKDTLGKYYEKWFFDTRKYAEHCRAIGRKELAEIYDKKHEILNEVLREAK